MKYEVIELTKIRDGLIFRLKNQDNKEFSIKFKKFFIPNNNLEFADIIRDKKEYINYSKELEKADGPGKRLFANNIPSELLNEEFYCLLLDFYGPALAYFEDSTITYEMCKRACLNDPMSLKFVPKNMMTDEIIMISIIKNGVTLQYVEKDKRKEEYYGVAFESSPNALRYIPREYITLEMCIDAVKRDMACIYYVPDEWLLYVYKVAIVDRGLVLPEYNGVGRKKIVHYKFQDIIRKIKILLQSETTIYYGLLDDKLSLEQTILETSKRQRIIDEKREYIDKLFEIKETNKSNKKK